MYVFIRDEKTTFWLKNVPFLELWGYLQFYVFFFIYEYHSKFVDYRIPLKEYVSNNFI